MGWAHADFPEHCLYEWASMPVDEDGSSIPWQVGILWDMCPAYYARHSPHAVRARRLLADMAGIRNGYEPPQKWAKPGADLVLKLHSLRELLQLDHDKRGAKKG